MCDCCPRALPKNKAHKNVLGPENFIVVNHLEGMTTEKIVQEAEKCGATENGKYFVLFGDFGADPELYTKEQLDEKLSM